MIFNFVIKVNVLDAEGDGGVIGKGFVVIFIYSKDRKGRGVVGGGGSVNSGIDAVGKVGFGNGVAVFGGIGHRHIDRVG